MTFDSFGAFPFFLRLLHKAWTDSLLLRLLPYAYTFCLRRYCGNACVHLDGEALRDPWTAEPPTLTIDGSRT
jgi:hypothetical protein